MSYKNNPLRSSKVIPDYTGDHYYANVLAKRLQHFWQKAGYTKVKVWVETEITGGGNKFYSVRSNISFDTKDLRPPSD